MNSTKIKIDEGNKCLQAIDPSNKIIALEVKGNAWTTAKLAQQIENYFLNFNLGATVTGTVGQVKENATTVADLNNDGYTEIVLFNTGVQSASTVELEFGCDIAM